MLPRILEIRFRKKKIAFTMLFFAKLPNENEENRNATPVHFLDEIIIDKVDNQFSVFFFNGFSFIFNDFLMV